MSRWICVVALLLVVVAAPGSGQPLDQRVLRPRDIVPLLVQCGGPRQVCCTPPRPIDFPATSGPLVTCNTGLGCDLASNTCVSPCGRAGQVCCDGPDTRAPQWTSDGRVYVPTGLVREMCTGAVCDPQERRCKASCGLRKGQACCPPQPGIGVGTCQAPTLICDLVVGSNPYGTCQACGRLGQPSCAGGCFDRSVEQNGMCVGCGYPGMPVCNGDPPCNAGAAPHPTHHATCVEAGWNGQPCMPGSLCHGGNQCNSRNICESCGMPGQRCCHLAGVAPCSPGECSQGVCKACGYFNQPQCATEPLCREGTPHGGFCRPCGDAGQPCCRGMLQSCNAGMQCRDDACRVPSAGGGVSNPRTCGGNPYTFSTRQIEVFYEDENSCGARTEVTANTPEEALQCARNLVGDRVIGLQASMHQVYLSCPSSGCTSQQYLARDQESAEACAEFSQPNCEVLSVPCQ